MKHGIHHRTATYVRNVLGNDYVRSAVDEPSFARDRFNWLRELYRWKRAGSQTIDLYPAHQPNVEQWGLCGAEALRTTLVCARWVEGRSRHASPGLEHWGAVREEPFFLQCRQLADGDSLVLRTDPERPTFKLFEPPAVIQGAFYRAGEWPY